MAGGRQCDPADGGVEHDFVGWHFGDDVSVQPFAEAVSGEYAQQWQQDRFAVDVHRGLAGVEAEHFDRG